VDLLHSAVAEHKEDRDRRRLLIRLKRDVFNLRPPASNAPVSSIAGALSQPGQRLFQEWVDLWQSHQEASLVLEQTFQQELVGKRALLKEAVARPDFRKGLLLASPLLSASVDSYLSADNQHLDREARTVERSLVEYLQRTACKTSPFSTLTSVCDGHVTNDEAREEAILCQVSSLEKESFTNLNLALLSRLSSFILSSQELWRDLPVSLAVGWERRSGRIRYVRRKQQLQEADEEAAVVIDPVQEELFYLPQSPCLTLIIQVLEQHQTLKIGELIAHVCQHGAYSQLEEAVTTYIEHLLRLGLLTVPMLHLDIHSQEPVRDYCLKLLALRTPLAARLAQHLQTAAELAADYARAPLAGRQRLLGALRAEAESLYAELGQAKTQVPRTLLYEDTLIHPDRLALNERQWDAIRADLAEFQRLLPVFDIHLPRKLATRGYFLARYGAGARCDDFLSFADAFNSEFFLQYTRETIAPGAVDAEGRIIPYRNHLHMPEFDRLNHARQAVADFLKQASARHSAEQTACVLDSAFFEAIAPLAPRPAHLQAHMFFSQFVRVEGEPLLVINRVYSGLGTMFSRFARYFTEEEKSQHVVEGLRATLQALQPPGAVFAELKGGYEATNLNLHPWLTHYELVCPGEISQRPAEEQILLTDLYLQDDPRSQCLRLYSKRLGKEVIPVYLGFLVPMMLPNIQQVLLNFSSLSLCFPDLWSTLQSAPPQEVVFYPRLRYKHLVLQRAMWQMPLKAFPGKNSDESAFGYYQRVVRWSRQHHLPTRVFLNLEQISSDNEVSRVQTRSKPLYVDFENYFSVSLLESTLRNTEAELLIWREMLPDMEQLWFEHRDERYVTEILLEMNSPVNTGEESHAEHAE
jgi:hypothetical protein